MITGVDRRSPIHSSRPSPSSDHRSVYPFPDLSERDLAVRADYYPPSFTASTAFRASNACAKAAPLVTRPVDSRSFQNSYFVPLSDQPRSDRAWMGNSGMIKSKSLDKLDEIMRNDPILRDDYHSAVPSSKSAQTQTDVVYTKKRPRRKRNDRPRSQILPPTYLQLPSVTWLPDELDGAESKGLEPPSKGLEAPNDFYCQNYPRRSHRRKSKEEQAQIVQRWITEMIEHKKAQEFLKQGVMPVVTREKSAKLKKKSRSVPEHSFRGNPAKFEHERRASDDSDNLQRKRQRQIYDTKCTDVSSPKLRHSDSDPSVRSALSRRFGDEMAVSVNTTSVGTSTTQTVGISPGASPIVDENISPSLQSRIRSLEQSFKQDNLSASSLHSNNNSLEVTRQLARPIDDSPSSTSGQSNRARVSNPDLPLISHLLSGNELDSQC